MGRRQGEAETAPRGRLIRPAFGTVAGWLVFGGLLVLWAWHTRNSLAVEGDPARWAMRDFRDGIYYPGRAWLDGVNPYSPGEFLGHYPATQLFPLVSPGVLLLNAPFALLSYEHALVAYFAFSVLLLLAYAPILLATSGIRATPARLAWLAAFLVASRPAYSTLTLGQSVLPVAIGVTLALHYARTRPALGGLGLCLAVLKPTFGVPLAGLMLARREYRAIWIGVVMSAALAAIPLVTIIAHTGIGAFVSGIGETLAEWGSHPSVQLTGVDVGRFDASAALARLFRIPLADSSSLPVALVFGGAAFYAVHRLHGHRSAELRPAAAPYEGRSLSSLIILLATLLAVYHQRYDAIVLGGPILALLAGRPAELSPRTRRLSLLLLVAVWFNYLATTTGIRVAGLTPWRWPWRIAVSLNAVALIVVFALACVAALRTTPGGTAGPHRTGAGNPGPPDVEAA